MVYYSDNGLVTYFDYEEAIATARIIKKPLLVEFTGINCRDCKKMEIQVLHHPKVIKMLKDEFLIVSLYVDAHDIPLQEHEKYFSPALGKRIDTMGDKNADLQVTKFGTNSQPYYFFLDGEEKRLATEGYGYDPDINKFTKLLDTVKEAYNKSSK